MLLSCSFVKLVFIGSNDPKLKSKNRSKIVSRCKITFVTGHGRSNEEDGASEHRSLPAKGSPLLVTSCAAGEYCMVQCVCVDCILSLSDLRFSQ